MSGTSRRSASSESLERADLLTKVLELRSDPESKEYRRALGLLLVAYHGLIAGVAYAYRRKTRHLQLQDLIAEGQIGFCAGVERFDPGYGAQLSTYVGYWVRTQICRAVRDQESEIRVPRDSGARAMRPVDLHDCGDAFVAAAHDPLESLTEAQERGELPDLLAGLTVRERTIVQLRIRGFTCREVGRLVRLSAQRASTIETLAAAKLQRIYARRHRRQ